MTADRARQIRELFDRAAGLSPEEARAFLAEACRDTPSLLEEVSELLEHARRADAEGFLAVTPPPGLTGSAPGGPGEARFAHVRDHKRGGLGMVTLAFDGHLGRPVAKKEIRPDRQGLVARRRFLREAAITARLQHPGIVPIYDLTEGADGLPYYLMRFVEGRTLGEAIADYHRAPGPLGLRELLQRFVDVCQTVAYAHSRGVIHRDLKPANVLLGDYGETLVIDWGLAKQLTPEGGSADAEGSNEEGSSAEPERRTPREMPLTLADTVMGTPEYMAPEQARGEANPASDIYSLGAILYEILAGRPPFAGETSREALLERLRSGGTPRPPGASQGKVPRSLEAICHKAMAAEVSERYPSAEALTRDLELYLADEPVSARRETLGERIWRGVRRHRLGAAVAAAVLLTAVPLLTVSTAWIAGEKGKTETALGEAQRNEREAREQTKRAEGAERQVRVQLAREQASAGRLAMQRGQWPEALERLGRALAGGHPDPVAVRLDQANALQALGNDPEARRLVAQVEKSDVPAEHRGRLHLIQGRLALGQDNEKAEGFFRQALDAAHLSQADRAFVQGHLAENSRDALGHLQTALKEDPNHHAARVDAAAILLVLGDLDEAEFQMAQGEALYPQDPNFLFGKGLLLALRGDLPGAKRLLLERKLALVNANPDVLAFVLETFADLRGDVEPLIRTGDPSITFKYFGKLAKVATILPRLGKGPPEEVAEALLGPGGPGESGGPPFPPILMRSIVKQVFLVVTAIQERNRPPSDRFVTAAEEAFRIHPDGFNRFMRAETRWQRNRHRGKGLGPTDAAERKEIAELEAEFARAAEEPAWFDIRAYALDRAVEVARLLAADKPGEADREIFRRMAGYMRKRLAIRPVGARDPVSDVLALYADCAHHVRDHHLMRAVLAQWERIAPDEEQLHRRQAVLESESGNHVAALRAARKALKGQPGDAKMRGVEKEALAAIKGLD